MPQAMEITRDQLLASLRQHRLAVECSVSPNGGPQAAVVGVAVTDDFEIIFDCVEASRKLPNLRQNPRIAFVLGTLSDGDEWTIQYEGLADEPQGSELADIQQRYFKVFPDGPDRLGWPGITYVRVRPTWLRYSDFGHDPPVIVEFKKDELAALK